MKHIPAAIRGFRGTPRKPLIALAFAFCAFGALAQAAPRDLVITPEQHFQMALESQSERDYPQMLARLKTAASLGHVEAQETLGVVLLVGSSVYGGAVSADRCEAHRWFLAAARAGSELGRANVEFLNRVRAAPRGRNACEGA